MIVVDANVIAYLVLKGDHTRACSKLWLMDSDWFAPRLWRDELANILATYERNGLLDRKEALMAFGDAEAVIGDNEYSIGIERILSVSRRTGRSGYDSQYIALAEDLNLKLYTYDRAILSACKEVAMKPAKP